MAKSNKSVTSTVAPKSGICVLFLDLASMSTLPDFAKLPGFLGTQMLTQPSVKRGISLKAADGDENPVIEYNGAEWYLAARASMKGSSAKEYGDLRTAIAAPAAKVAAVAVKAPDADKFLSAFGLGK